MRQTRYGAFLRCSLYLKRYIPIHSLARSYHADAPPPLVKLQAQHWQPILDWAVKTLGVEIATTNSFLVPEQSPQTIQKLDDILKTFSPWEMAGAFLIKLCTACIAGR